MAKITNIDEAYNLLVVKDYWEQPSIDICNNIVEFLNDYIKHNPNDAKAYYLRSMAKFHQSDIVPNEYNISGKSCDKFLATITDDAFEDYNKAISIDSNIVNKNPNVRTIRASCITGLKYYFRKPVNSIVLNNITGNKQCFNIYEFIIPIFSGIFLSLSIFPFPIIKNYRLYSFLLCIIFLFIGNLIQKYTLKKAKILSEKYCEFVEPATYEEIK